MAQVLGSPLFICGSVVAQRRVILLFKHSCSHLYEELCKIRTLLFFAFMLLFCLFTFAGWMYDHSGSYDSGFVFLGVVQATGGLVFAADHLYQNWKKNKQNKHLS